MRFYQNKQADMLRTVSYFLNQNSEKLSSKVPAMKNFINEFVKMEAAVYSIRIRNPQLVNLSTMEKLIIKKEFIKALTKLIAVLNATGYRVKNKPLAEMEYEVYQLKKLSADKLCEVYLKVFAAVKKVKNLPYFGLTEGDMRDMQAYYNEFSGIKKAPAHRKKEVAMSNKQMSEGVKECIIFLKKHIDKMMLIATEDEQLQLTYKARRKVLGTTPGRPADAEVAYRKSRERKKE